MSEQEGIRYVRIPRQWIGSLAVERLEDTRWYVERGPITAFRQWLKEVSEAMSKQSAGILVPLQWAPSLVGVSREAVNKRAKNGTLTVFSFVITEHKRTRFGGSKVKDSKKRYDLVPFRELNDWRDMLFEAQNPEGA